MFYVQKLLSENRAVY